MAVDRKADYVGNHGGTYTDIDGMSRQFTTIDHDIKSKISFGGKETSFQREWRELSSFIIQHNPEADLSEITLGEMRTLKKEIDERLQKQSNKKNK